MHVDLHAELHDIENGRPADSAPHFARLARFSFTLRTPPPKNLKSSCSSRHKPPTPESPGPRTFWCGRRDLNSRTIHKMVSRVVGLEAHWTPRCYVLDQARLRPHESSASSSGFIYLTIPNPTKSTSGFEEEFRQDQKLPQPSVVIASSCEPTEAVSVRASGYIPASPYWTRDGWSCFSRPRHFSSGGPSHRWIRVWSYSCSSRLATR